MARRRTGALMTWVVLLAHAVAVAHAEPCVVVDQRNLVSNGNSSVAEDQMVTQSFVTGLTGQLVGIEIAPLLDTLAPDARVFLDVYDGAEHPLGTVSRAANDFPPGSGVPAPLREDTVGPGYFDLTSLGILVAPGAAASFRIRHEEIAECDEETSTCVAGGSIGLGCDEDGDCYAQIRVGDTFGDPYPYGESLDSRWDLAFKTFVAVPCPTATPAPTVTPTPAATATPVGTCPAVPSTTCRAPAPSRATLAITARPDDPTRTRLEWTWANAGTTTTSDLGDPTSTDDYRLCLYDAGALVAATRIPAGGTCAGKPCWKARTTGFRFADATLERDGVRELALTVGRGGRAKLRLRGRGADVRAPSPATITGPITVQLARTGDATCWSGLFTPPFAVHDGLDLRARSS